MATIKYYTWAEIAQRNGKNGQPIWIAYKNSVYDVTKYIYEHPGGDGPIAEEAGTDATKTYDEIGHSSDAREILAKFKIGEIVEHEQKYDANGKKKKRVVSAQPENDSRGCLSVVTCGLLG